MATKVFETPVILKPPQGSGWAFAKDAQDLLYRTGYHQQEKVLQEKLAQAWQDYLKILQPEIQEKAKGILVLFGSYFKDRDLDLKLEVAAGDLVESFLEGMRSQGIVFRREAQAAALENMIASAMGCMVSTAANSCLYRETPPYYERAVQFRVEEKWGEALAAVNAEIAQGPQDPLVYFEKGYALQAMGKYPESREAFLLFIERESRAQNPNNLNLGHAFLNMASHPDKEKEKERDYLQKAISFYEKGGVYRYLGNIYSQFVAMNWEEKNWDRVLEYLQKQEETFLRIAPVAQEELALTCWNRGRVLRVFLDKKAEDYLPHYDKAVDYFLQAREALLGKKEVDSKAVEGIDGNLFEMLDDLPLSDAPEEDWKRIEKTLDKAIAALAKDPSPTFSALHELAEDIWRKSRDAYLNLDMPIAERLALKVRNLALLFPDELPVGAPNSALQPALIAAYKGDGGRAVEYVKEVLAILSVMDEERRRIRARFYFRDIVVMLSHRGLYEEALEINEAQREFFDSLSNDERTTLRAPSSYDFDMVSLEMAYRAQNWQLMEHLAKEAIERTESLMEKGDFEVALAMARWSANEKGKEEELLISLGDPPAYFPIIPYPIHYWGDWDKQNLKATWTLHALFVQARLSEGIDKAVARSLYIDLAKKIDKRLQYLKEALRSPYDSEPGDYDYPEKVAERESLEERGIPQLENFLDAIHERLDGLAANKGVR